MVTKAIVEEIINNYQARVRIPIFNKAKGVNLATPSDELPVATICCLPNIFPKYHIGDVVYVAFEDNNISTPVIIGILYAENVGKETFCEVKSESLNVTANAQLPDLTTIGSITGYELQMLQGVTKPLKDINR